MVCLLLVIQTGCTQPKTQSQSEPETQSQSETAAEPETEPQPEIPEKDYSETWRDRPMPESFDLRSVDTDGDGIGDRCYVTPVRFQNPFGTCWGFAAIAAAEISILGNNLKYEEDAWKTLDLSEKQLAYFTNVPLNDPDNPQNGEGITPDDITDASQVYDRGGTAFLATSTFAQGIGPSAEQDGRYGEYFIYCGKEHNADQRYIDGRFRKFSYSAEDDWTIPEEYRFARNYTLAYSHILPSPAQYNFTGSYMYYRDATNKIKEELLDKRGVMIAFCADTSLPSQDVTEGVFIDLKNWAHYTWSEAATPNHAVTIVGWDDNYPKENFLADHQPPENGAWLVKNSWGSGEEDFPASGTRHWGIEVPETDENGDPVLDENGEPVMVGSGYFWLSYFDMSLRQPESFSFIQGVSAEETVYQHDYLSAADIYVAQFFEPVRMANVFTSRHAEILNDISCVTNQENTIIDYAIYLLDEDADDPEQGYLAASGTEIFEYGGFHRITMDDNIFLQEGQKYSVVITMQDSYETYYVNTPIGLSLKGMMNQKAVINPQESFIFAEGEWRDYKKIAEEDWAEEAYESFGGKLYYDNFPIKAYTTYQPGNMKIVLNASERELSTREGKNTARVGVVFRSQEDYEVGEPEIKWELVPGAEEILDMEIEPEGNAVNVTAKKFGNAYVAASVEGIGTSVIRIAVRKLIPVRYLPAVNSKEYTGEPVETAVMVLAKGNVKMTEGEDYTLQFSNNVSCGIAKAEICDADGYSFDPPAAVYFAIKPQKAEITKVSAENGRIRLTVKDQWESGISGYEAAYREAGSAEWQKVQVTEGTAIILNGLESGEYEVRVRAFVDTRMAEKDVYNSDFYYGEYSGTETVSVK